ncbi:MAG: PorT family protein [Bacteroidales bacterium]|nr:PorT family protein [Bacteroidales bacterium]
MKKNIFLALLTIGFSSFIFAQSVEKGIKGGVNLASLSVDNNNDKNLKVGLHAGFFAKFPITSALAIQPELLYSAKGIKLNYDESNFADGSSKFNLNYIDIPVKLVFNLSDDFSFHLGPYFSFLLNANVVTDAEVLDFWDIDSVDDLDTDRFNTFDYGFVGGLEFNLKPVVLGFSYNLGLNQVAKDKDLAYDIIGDAKNSVIQVFVGIKF